MADNVDITAGTGTSISTNDASGAHVQRVHGTVEQVRLAVTPTISTSAYAAKDAIGGILTFANAARWSGGTGTIVGVTIIDKDQELANIDLILFDQTIAGTVTDNSPFDPTDADLANCVGVVSIGSGFYADFSDNSVAHVNVAHPFVLAGTSLFGALVSRGTPTYTGTSDIIVILTIAQD